MGVDILIDVTQEDQVEGQLVPEGTEGAMRGDEEFPRVAALMEAPHRDPLRHM